MLSSLKVPLWSDLPTLGIIASRILLASSDTKGEKKDQTYCPTTWNYACAYDTPSSYSDQLPQNGAESLLTHECVLSVIAQMSNKSQRHPQCAFAHSPSCVLSGTMVSLTPVYALKVPRTIKLEEPVQFESLDQLIQVLNGTLSVTEDFVEVPKPRDECRILIFGPKEPRQYRVCPEQDCEQLVFHFNQQVSVIETLELHEEIELKERAEIFRGWYKYTKNTWTRGSSEQSKGWKGTSKRASSMPVSLEESRTNPVKKAFPWKDIGDANVDPDFLYPTSEEHPCPVQQSKKMSKQEASQYLQLIVKVVPGLEKKSKDERVYCAHCDMSNHPRFFCQFYYKHRSEKHNHQCTLRTGKHAPFQHARAQVNGGVARPNWARK